MHHPADRITHTTAFVTPVMEHWLEREIAQWVHQEGLIRRPIAPWANALTTELHLAPPWRIDPMTHNTMSERSYHGATSRSQNPMWRNRSLTLFWANFFSSETRSGCVLYMFRLLWLLKKTKENIWCLTNPQKISLKWRELNINTTDQNKTTSTPTNNNKQTKQKHHFSATWRQIYINKTQNKQNKQI